MTRKVEIAIVGAGTAGLGALREAMKAGRDAVLIEGGLGGTTCARVGCMPSKLLIAAADHAHSVRAARRFGVKVSGTVDGEAVMSRVRSERDRFVGFVMKDVEAMPEGVFMRGGARFASDMLLEVDGERVEAEKIVLAVGNRSIVPPPLLPASDRLIHNDDVFDFERLPDSVAVFGPGIIGLELGQALHRLGVRVRVFGLSGRVGPLEDPELKSLAARLFSEELAMSPKVVDLEVDRVEGGVRINWREGDESRSEVFEYALVAVGRRSNLDRLNLDSTTLPRTEKGGLSVDEYTLQVEDRPVFVAGDAAGIRPVLHEASDEGRIAGRNAVPYPDVTPGRRRSPLSIVFTDPQMIMVGASHGSLSGDFVTGRVSFENQGRSRVMGVNQGALHVYADPSTGRLLGAEGIGPRLEHIAHLLAWSHQTELTVGRMLEMPFYHPVIEEGLRTALRDAFSKQI